MTSSKSFQFKLFSFYDKRVRGGRSCIKALRRLPQRFSLASCTATAASSAGASVQMRGTKPSAASLAQSSALRVLRKACPKSGTAKPFANSLSMTSVMPAGVLSCAGSEAAPLVRKSSRRRSLKERVGVFCEDDCCCCCCC